MNGSLLTYYHPQLPTPIASVAFLWFIIVAHARNVVVLHQTWLQSFPSDGLEVYRYIDHSVHDDSSSELIFHSPNALLGPSHRHCIAGNKSVPLGSCLEQARNFPALGGIASDEC